MADWDSPEHKTPAERLKRVIELLAGGALRLAVKPPSPEGVDLTRPRARSPFKKWPLVIAF